MDDVQYVVDGRGDRTAVLIPLKGNESAVEEFLEDLYGHEKIRERRHEERIPSGRFLQGLKLPMGRVVPASSTEVGRKE